MTQTYLLLALLLLLALVVLGYVLWPLLRPAKALHDPAAEIARDVLRARRDELLTSLAHLPPDAPERAAALAEFAAQAQGELHQAHEPGATAKMRAHGIEAGTAQPSRRPLSARLMLAASALLLLITPSALYLIAGMPEAVSPAFIAAQQAPSSIEELVSRLQARLQEAPDDAEGWMLLGRSELSRSNAAAAATAFERASSLRPKDAAILADLADAIAQREGRSLEGRPMELVRQALALDPNQGKALALAGAWEVNQGNLPQAIALWTRLLGQLEADSAQARQIAGFIDDLKAGRKPGTGPASASSGASASPSSAVAATPAALRGRVEIDPALRDRIGPGTVLFVVARALDASGQPSGAPLAVIRTEAGAWPLAFSLDDAQAMSPASRLSAQPPGTRIAVIARLSRTGEAALRTGDLLGSSAPVMAGAQDVLVHIDSVAP